MAVTVSIKMYRMNELGDCFLLHFKDGNKESRVLIDCGSFRNGEKSKTHITKVVNDIKASLGNKKLDVVVGTHQHNDHLSGFYHCEELFKDMVNQVWLSWLDNSKDAFGRKVQRDHKGLVQQLKAISVKLDKLGISNEHSAVKDALGFFGASGDDPEVPSKAVEVLKRMGEEEPAYLSPGSIIGLPGLEDAVKVYVLGPPRKKALLFDKDPSKDQTYDPHLALAEVSASKILAALDNQVPNRENSEEEQFPFNKVFKKKSNDADKDIKALYNRRKDAYRKIDEDWLAGADRLALFLDGYTNNSSLVLAFELVRSGKVLLFAADAQAGNWISWDKVKWQNSKNGFSTNNLLQNTVLYKVGHHGSHNATLVQALEEMNHPELVAMIPVDRTDGNITKRNGWKMPAKNLYQRLKEKTNYRILMMDSGFADGCDPKHKKSKWKDLPKVPRLDKKKLFFEYVVEG